MEKRRTAKKIQFNDDTIFNVINVTIITLFVAMVLYPVIFTFAASISSGSAVDTGRVSLLPVEATFSAYRTVISDVAFWRSYWNAIHITFNGTLFNMFISLTGAYALSKKDLPGHKLFNFILIVTMWFGPGMIPMFINFQNLGMLGSFWGLIVGFAVNAFNIVLLRGAFSGVSSEMIEAATIDGANNLQIFWRMAVPSIKPTLVTVWVMFGIGRWNGFFWTMIMLNDPKMVPLQVYLRRIVIEREVNLEFIQVINDVAHSQSTLIYATIVLSMLPIIIIFPYISKFFRRGMMDGGVKG